MKTRLQHILMFLLPRVAPGNFFSPFERAPYLAAAEVLLEGCPVKMTAEEGLKNMENFLVSARSQRAWRIRILLVIVELAPLFLLGKKRFSKLSLEDRKTLMATRFQHGSHVWAICGKIKQLVYLGVYGDKRAERAIGFVPWYERPRFSELKRGDLKSEVHPLPDTILASLTRPVPPISRHKELSR